MLARFSKLLGERHQASRKRGARRGEKGIAVFLTAGTLILIIPIIGLAFDASVLYAVNAVFRPRRTQPRWQRRDPYISA